MQIKFSKQESRVPVTIMQLTGELDASNYAMVITQAQDIYGAGARNLLIDLSQVQYISSTGLMSLHTVALIFAGYSMNSKESGRPLFRSINAQNEKLVRQHLKLLNLQPAVEEVLDVVGLKQFLDIYTDLETALKAF
jgi:anti-anti-sigma regulatory factor